MVRRKAIRTRGKIPLSKYFQELKIGDKIAVVREKTLAAFFPSVLQGRTGTIEQKRGRSFLVKLNDKNRVKQYLIAPIHLKKITTENKK